MAPELLYAKSSIAKTVKPKARPNSSLNSSALIRCLLDRAIVNAADVAQLSADAGSQLSFAEQLGLWLNWTDAIALSAALGANRVTTAPANPSDAQQPTAALTAALQRVRGDLAQAIRSGRSAEGAAHDSDHSTADCASHRRNYRAHQQAMETHIAALRTHVRAVLSGLSLDLNRLAALDAVLDKALAARERHVLSTLPSLLERHFNRLRAGLGVPGETSVSPSAGWHAVFCSDMQAALLAELDLRLHAVEGLIEAIPQ